MNLLLIKNMKNKLLAIITIIITFCITIKSNASEIEIIIKGKVTSQNTELSFANIYIKNYNVGGRTNVKGEFSIKVKSNEKFISQNSLNINIHYLGYKNLFDTIIINKNEIKNSKLTIERNFNMIEEPFKSEETVVSATRNEVSIHEAPIIVNSINRKLIESTQSINLAESINFTPGLRIENNCQNCGFTQVRMNGLDGAYSQILVNSRPIFSALTGVYGLEMLPANMIEKIEIVRGGGSSLYGGSAIAGTINIITKEPIENTFDISLQKSFIDSNIPDNVVAINSSIVSDDYSKGMLIYGFNRNREPYDYNKDGFSELTKINNTTFGFDAFYNFSILKKLKLVTYIINEERRGGNKFDLAPHLTDITEQLIHKIIGVTTSYEQFSEDLSQKFSIYSSFQTVNRNSYYGGGGRILTFGDTLNTKDIIALNSYGLTSDYTLNSGLFYSNQLLTELNMILGVEYTYNNVNDNIPGYQRIISQNVNTLGAYSQFDYDITDNTKILIGNRLDYLKINGNYNLFLQTFKNDKSILNLINRIALMQKIIDDNNEKLKFRVSYAEGYRGPQAFDEDLHLQTIGGAARFTFLDSNIVTEKSKSYNLSFDYLNLQEESQFNFVSEFFYTNLLNPFILSNQIELENGISVITKRNGSGANVFGVNLEANYFSKDFITLQSGFTIQNALYKENEVIWEPSTNNIDSLVTTQSILRTPNYYGYLNIIYDINELFNFTFSSVYTGKMFVPKVVDINNEFTELRRTKDFLEINLKASYKYNIDEHFRLEFSLGSYNIFNQYQNDFDFGKNRDAGYVYGPNRPRTYYFGIKYGIL